MVEEVVVGVLAESSWKGRSLGTSTLRNRAKTWAVPCSVLLEASIVC